MTDEQSFLYENIANDISSLIDQGTFRPGERIPSVRQLSRQRKISITTALQAYLLNPGGPWIDRGAPTIGLLRARQAPGCTA
jgi:DNA-binding transcriptional MocR family regulator